MQYHTLHNTTPTAVRTASGMMSALLCVVQTLV